MGTGKTVAHKTTTGAVYGQGWHFRGGGRSLNVGRSGEMIVAQKKTVGLNEGGRPLKTGSEKVPVSKPTLAEAGIDKKISARARESPPPRLEDGSPNGLRPGRLFNEICSLPPFLNILPLTIF
jgi:hypothetical protein